MKVALGQIDCVGGDVDANLKKHVEYIREAASQGANLIVFPELSLTGDKIGPNIPDVSLSLESDALLEICELSNQIDIVVGLIERSESNLYNRYNSAFYFSECTLVHRHRKLFLVNYAVFEEAKHFVPGNNLQAFDAGLGRMGMLVCNDVWHAPAPYIAALDGAEMLVVPTNSARGTLADNLDIVTTWESMNRAYSAMMGYYYVFVNRVGVRKDVYGEFPYWGGSEILSPDGELVVKAPYDEEALIMGEVDMEMVAAQRFNAPIIRDARLWIVQQETERLAIKRSEAVRLPGSRIPLGAEGGGFLHGLPS
jgi:predicted amidohydrolase